MSFRDLEEYSTRLANAIQEHYYRYIMLHTTDIYVLFYSILPYLCRAVRNFVCDQAGVQNDNKEYYIAFVDFPTRYKYITSYQNIFCKIKEVLNSSYIDM